MATLTLKQISDLNYLSNYPDQTECNTTQNAYARALIRRMKTENSGTCYLGKLDPFFQDLRGVGIVQYTHGRIYNFGYDFVIPKFDFVLDEILKRYHNKREPLLFNVIYERVSAIGGYWLHWS